MIVPITFYCHHQQAIESCVAAAGFSVGEFAALVFSGSMNFAEGKEKNKWRADLARFQPLLIGICWFSSSVCSEGPCRGHAESLRHGS